MFENLKADFARYRGYGYRRGPLLLLFEQHQVWAIVCYRFGNWLSRSRAPKWVRLIPLAVYHVWWKIIQITTGIWISGDATIGPGLYIGHFGQIFIGAESTLGSYCNLSQGVTLGVGRRAGEWGVPQLGDRVYLAPGAKVVGPIRLEDGVVVGANAVMLKDAPADTVWAGIPARPIAKSGSAEYMGPDVPLPPDREPDDPAPEAGVEGV